MFWSLNSSILLFMTDFNKSVISLNLFLIVYYDFLSFPHNQHDSIVYKNHT